MIKIKLLFISIIPFFIFILGCQEKGTEFMDEKIEESSELEEYIIAGLDLKYSLSQFKQELKSIDMLSLKPTLDSYGNLVINVPSSISIEAKSRAFNAKKKILLEKYPELKNIKSELRRDYIKETIDNSIKVTKAMMEFNFITNAYRFKDATIENFASEQDSFAFLDQQIASPDYVEVVLIVFEDGTATTYVRDDFTANSCEYPRLKKEEDQWFLFNSQYSAAIRYIGHTHRSNPLPSDEDLEAGGYIGLQQVIYTSGGNKSVYYTF